MNALLAMALSAVQMEPAGPKPKRRRRSAPAGINRNTGKPHEHKREIARRLRQQARATGDQS